MMKKIFAVLLILVCLKSFAQNDSIAHLNPSDFERRYVAWISPSQATHVYGFMFNLWAKDGLPNDGNYPKIYGTEINLNPIALVAIPVLAIYALGPETHQPTAETLDSINFQYFKKIYGLQVGTISMEPTIINGLDINVGGSFGSKVNGVTISGVMNKHYFVNGVTIAVVGNHDTKCNGVQIGLINSCRQLKGFQFGLWNENQKRSLPLINWCFSTK